jgi:hypothetical protein
VIAEEVAFESYPNIRLMPDVRLASAVSPLISNID